MESFLTPLVLSGGEWVIWGLMLCSVVAVAVIFERGVLIRRESKKFSELRHAVMKEVSGDISGLDKVLSRHSGAACRILRAGLNHAQHGAAVVEDLLVSASFDERMRLEKRLLVLGTLGNNAPFVGLFGTVLGVIKAFHDLAQSGAGPEVVMRGLSEALIATAVGLFVAIPCVVSYNFFQKRVRDLLGGTESLGRLMVAQIRAGKSVKK